MQLPVLFHNESAESVVARTKQYEVKLHHFLVDVEDDIQAFISHGWTVVAEGEYAIERFAGMGDQKADAPIAPAPIVDVSIVPIASVSVPSTPAPNATQTKAATSKGKSAAK